MIYMAVEKAPTNRAFTHRYGPHAADRSSRLIALLIPINELVTIVSLRYFADRSITLCIFAQPDHQGGRRYR